MRWRPYQISIHHDLKDANYLLRVVFEPFEPIFWRMLWFCMNGEVNSHNVRQYAPRGAPPDFNYEGRDERWKITVCKRICGNGALLGVFFFARNFDCNAHLEVLNNSIIGQLIDLFDNQFQDGHFQRLWFAQDGGTAHQLIAVRNKLLETFQNRVIALHLPVV